MAKKQGDAHITVSAPQGTTPDPGGYGLDAGYAKIVATPPAYGEWDGTGTYWKDGP